jgi:N-acyl amino acid synthase of PEP-CTERM/exosortase system
MSHIQSAAGRQDTVAGISNLSKMYSRWFEIIFANTPALREKAFRLRYQVYCNEHAYEIPEEHPQELEMDAYDSRSIHSLILDRASGTVTGTVRLVLPDKRAPDASFPIQQICSHPMLSNLLPGSAEVSRFAISKTIRKMAEHPMVTATGRDGKTPAGKTIKCSITLGLMRATVQMSLAYGITDWFAVMEPSLLRLLCRFGICFEPIGPLVEYHGFRQPCHINLETLLETVRREHPELWEFVMESNGSFAKIKTAVSF